MTTFTVVGDSQISGARFSEDRVYRYALWRDWNPLLKKRIAWIGLNPSTADEVKNDPTVRRCILFSQRWGFDQMVMLNIFALRSTNPGKLFDVADPVGEENDQVIEDEVKSAEKVVCAWGVHGRLNGRGRQVIEMLSGSRFKGHVFCLGQNKDGSPKHPLYLKSNTVLVPLTNAK